MGFKTFAASLVFPNVSAREDFAKTAFADLCAHCVLPVAKLVMSSPGTGGSDYGGRAASALLPGTGVPHFKRLPDLYYLTELTKKAAGECVAARARYGKQDRFGWSFLFVSTKKVALRSHLATIAQPLRG